MEEEPEVFIGSGNVFADLGLPDPEERQLKAYPTMQLEQVIRSERPTEKQVTQNLGLGQHNLTELLEEALSEHSVNQLIQHLKCLGRDVELSATVRERVPEAKKREQKEEREAVAA